MTRPELPDPGGHLRSDETLNGDEFARASAVPDSVGNSSVAAPTKVVPRDPAAHEFETDAERVQQRGDDRNRTDAVAV